MSAASPSPADPSVASLLAAFTGDIRPTPVSPVYTAGLTVVAFAMVLLPAIYFALILLAGWLVLYHLGHNTWILEGSGGAMGRLILYVGPAIAGSILVFFMLKPLFAPRPRPAELPSLPPVKEPLLFAFVQHICRLVRAPVPCRIDVDCQVNASACLRRGLWSRDLVLTIGLPLAAGLDMRQFAGVLAHEFGHFAQGAGMRLTYVIRNINHWFARVVYERDKWDMNLEHWARNTDLRIGIILHAARGCVWLTRRILWLLMHVGHAISCFMLRQMEFDADSYEAKLAGSDAFESTSARMQELNVAMQFAFEEVRQSWTGKRLPEDLPRLIQHKVGALPAEVREKLAGAAAAAKTGWFDTHPSDLDRVKAARALNEPGVFRVARPASELFADFAAASLAVTRHQYEKNWELEFSVQNLVSSAEMLRESAANAQADAAVRRFYGEVNTSLLPLLTELSPPPLPDRAAAAAQWREARERSEALKPEAQKVSAECGQQQRKLVELKAAQHLTAAGFKVDPKEFGLPPSASGVANQRIAAQSGVDQTMNVYREQAGKLGDFVAALRCRVGLALQLRHNCGRMEEDAAEVATLVSTLAAVGGVMPVVHEIGMRLRAFVLLAQNRSNHAKPEEVDAEMSRLADELRQRLTAVHSGLGELMFPFPHPRGPLNLVEYARYEKTGGHEWETIYRDSEAHLDRLFALHYRLLGRLLVIVGAAEDDLDPSFAHLPP